MAALNCLKVFVSLYLIRLVIGLAGASLTNPRFEKSTYMPFLLNKGTTFSYLIPVYGLLRDSGNCLTSCLMITCSSRVMPMMAHRVRKMVVDTPMVRIRRVKLSSKFPVISCVAESVMPNTNAIGRNALVKYSPKLMPQFFFMIYSLTPERTKPHKKMAMTYMLVGE